MHTAGILGLLLRGALLRHNFGRQRLPGTLSTGSSQQVAAAQRDSQPQDDPYLFQTARYGSGGYKGM